jgi:hypothetical protein
MPMQVIAVATQPIHRTTDHGIVFLSQMRTSRRAADAARPCGGFVQKRAIATHSETIQEQSSGLGLWELGLEV